MALTASFPLHASELSKEAQEAALYAHQEYTRSVIETLANLVSFPTVHEEGKQNRDLKAVKEMSRYLAKKAEGLGLEFKDYGDVAVISLGNQKERLGLITHGDVQPADSVKWPKGAFVLDTTSEPGKLIGRGAEDDKGSIALALYAMKAIKDQKIPLKRRVELFVSYTEESDWEPLQKFLEKNPPPQLNVGFDAEYPVVVAQKGWCSVTLHWDNIFTPPSSVPYLSSFTGGFFMSQVPEDAEVVIPHATPTLENSLKDLSTVDSQVRFSFEREGETLKIKARGKAAHSSEPQNGVNAITHLAELLAKVKWPVTPASQVVRYIHDLIGTGFYAEKFGGIAYKDPFMGPMTLSLSMVTEKGGKLSVAINLRRPSGKDKAVLEKEITDTVENWKKKNGVQANLELRVSDPHNQLDAPQVPALLGIFQHFTNEKNPKPISSGGGTHARLFPHGVDFGPAMPSVPYTGHTEHEFLTQNQLELNLKMYTAMIATLGNM